MRRFAFTPLILVLLLPLVGLSACSIVGGTGGEGAPQPPLTDSEWQLVRFDTDSLGPGVPEGQTYAVLFGDAPYDDPDSENDGGGLFFGATSDCNSVGGSYTASPGDGRVRLRPKVTTLAECSQESLGEEYTQLLRLVRSYEVTGEGNQQLVLYSEEEERLLTYQRNAR